MLLLLFRECLQAADAVVPILGYGPSAVEMIDGMMIELARKASRDYDGLLPTAAGACLLVECQGEKEDEEELVARLESIRSAIVEKERLAFASLMSNDQSKEAKIWELRKAGVPLLFRRPGDEQPVPFIEDVAVPVDRLSSYVSRLSSIFEKYGVKAAFYGHAGGGELHIRPYLNLRREKDVEIMERIAGDTFVLVRELGGSLSGEHGEGLVRGQFIRRMHPHTWPLFLQIKKTFDPRGMFNPDKIVVDDDRLMVKNLRFGSPYQAESPRLRLNYKEQPYTDIVERCNGCGECRSLEQYSMCPVFKETLLEAASPRAKANVLRNLLYGKVSEDSEFARAWKEIYDYCIACGMCAVECPSGVDIPRLMAEAKIRYAEKNGFSLTDLFLSESQLTCSVMSLFAPLVNTINRNRAARLVIEWLTGIDRRRKLPRFSLPRKKALRRNFAKGNGRLRVALFRDLFASYNDPSLGHTVVTLLEELLGAEVIVPDLGSCGITAMVYGNSKTALSQVKDNIAILSGLVDDGFVVVSQEPTSVLSLKVEYPGWVDSQEAVKIAANTFELFQYLGMMEEAGRMRPLSVHDELGMKLVYHAPCHLKALEIGRPSKRFLSRIPGLEIVESYAACCGIAGTFGMKADALRPVHEDRQEDIRKAGRSKCGWWAFRVQHLPHADGKSRQAELSPGGTGGLGLWPSQRCSGQKP